MDQPPAMVRTDASNIPKGAFAPTLMGTGDLEDRWGYTRAGVHKIVNDPAFPAPHAAINRGRVKVWTAAQIEAFERGDPRFGGTPDAARSLPNAKGPTSNSKGSAKGKRAASADGEGPKPVPAWLERPSLWDGKGEPKDGDRHDGMIFHRGEWHDFEPWQDRLNETALKIASARLRERLEREGKVQAYKLGYTFPAPPPARDRDMLKGMGWRYMREGNRWHGTVDAADYGASRRLMEGLGGTLLYDDPVSSERTTLYNEELDAARGEALDAM